MSIGPDEDRHSQPGQRTAGSMRPLRLDLQVY